MEEQLSNSTVRGNGILLGIGLLAVLFWVILAAVSFEHWDVQQRLSGGLWLLILAMNFYQLRFRQLTLTSTTILVTHLFARPVPYRLTDFAALHQTNLPYGPLRVCFKNGQSFLFAPQLKECPFSLFAVSKADFIDYWTQEIADRTAALA